MKKSLITLAIVTVITLAIALVTRSQITSPTVYQYQLLNNLGGQGTGQGTGVSVSGAWINVQNSGANYHQLTWTVTNAPASCTIQIDYSTNGSTVAGQVVAAQTCTTAGTFLNTSSITPAYVRVTYNLSSGSFIFFNAVGYMFLPASSGGTITSGSVTINGTGAGSIGLSQGALLQPIASGWNIVANTVEPATGINQIFPTAAPTTSGTLQYTLGTGGAGTVTCASCGTLTGGGNISISAAGTYTIPPACWITGGGGTGATCTVTALSAGTIIAANVSINNGGSGYTSNATLNFSNDIELAYGSTITFYGSTSGTPTLGCSNSTCTNIQASTAINATKYVTTSNCLLGGASGTASPAACGAAPAGKIAIPTSITTYTINTTAVTNNSDIIVQQITDNAGLPSSPTCGTTSVGFVQSSRTAATSFTLTLTSQAQVTCLAYWFTN